MVKTILGFPVDCSQTCSTSERGTALVAIFKPAGWTASKTLRIDWTNAARLRLPTPAPMSVIAEDRNAAPGNPMSGSPLTPPTCTKRTGLSPMVFARAIIAAVALRPQT
jgi:hypothetical protein